MALVGIYNADGNLMGELQYVLDKLCGRADCALCEITHGMNPLGRKSWKQALAQSSVEIELIHRDEADATQLAAAQKLPCVLRYHDAGDGASEWLEVLSAEELATFEASPIALLERLETLS